MIENLMRQIAGEIAIYGILSICLFVGCFSGVLLWAVRLKQPYLNSMRELPLEGEESHE